MFEGKKVVITQSSLVNFRGSEIVVLELAEYFASKGANVLVFTWCYGGEIEKEFKRRNITITDDEFDKRLVGADYVWVNHQVLPHALVDELAKKETKTKFLFYHMAANPDLFIEQPYIYSLEQQMASRSLCVSLEAKTMLLSLFPSLKKQLGILPNCVPSAFLEANYAVSNKLRRVLVVSNHVPEEINDLKALLEKQSIIMDFVGEQYKSRLVTPELLSKYDAVITIGKTVQYCLCMGIPVFVYDRYGGPGYLNDTNYELARDYNFSGRGFSQRKADVLVKEVVEKYNKALVFYEKERDYFCKNFSYDNNLRKLFENLEERLPVKNVELLNSTKAALGIGRSGAILAKTTEEQKRRIIELDHQLHLTESAYSRLLQSKMVRVSQKITGLLDKTKESTRKKHLRKLFSISRVRLIKKPAIVGILLERNESLLLDDTLKEMAKLVDAIVVVDDASTDDSVEIAKNNPSVSTIVKRKKWNNVKDRSSEEGKNREMALVEAMKMNPDWIVCLDADERIEEPEKVRNFMLKNSDNANVAGIKFSLFDAYMTKNDCAPYERGEKLYNFRRMFGQERRDIAMAWKASNSIHFPLDGNAARTPVGLDDKKMIVKFFVQHYGKSLSEDQWEETCRFYMNHFPEYAKKWESRLGKGVHDSVSDFGTKLKSWTEVKKTGGIKID